ncbi:MAG: homoserine kinase [Sarcina sp.]
MIYKVRVPATTANIGAGFDVMGIALNIYNKFEVEEIEEGFRFIGFNSEFANEDNIFLKSMLFLLEKYQYTYKGFKITMKEENIPIARGLGSSSTCIVGGLLIANEILDCKLSKKDLVEIATKIEGHPDNVAPAILGGLIVNVVEEDKLYYNKVVINEDLQFSCYIPSFKVSTEKARTIIPKTINLSDGIYNVSHGMLTLLAFINKDYELLKVSCNDKFHQPYRKDLIKNYETIRSIFLENNALCTFISGSGPTIIGIYKSEDIKNINDLETNLRNTNENFKLFNLTVDNKGAQVEDR